jgi:hypothetical protein
MISVKIRFWGLFVMGILLLTGSVMTLLNDDDFSFALKLFVIGVLLILASFILKQKYKNG